MPKDVIIIVCNANAVTDDIFDIEVNGHKIARLDLSPMKCVGGWFSSNPAITPQSVGPDSKIWTVGSQWGGEERPYDCCRLSNDWVIAPIPKKILHSGSNYFKMNNVHSNNNGNWGLLSIWNTDGGTPCSNLLDGTYEGRSGQDFGLSFTYLQGAIRQAFIEGVGTLMIL